MAFQFPEIHEWFFMLKNAHRDFPWKLKMFSTQPQRKVREKCSQNHQFEG